MENRPLEDLFPTEHGGLSSFISLLILSEVFFVYGEHSSIPCPSDPDVKKAPARDRAPSKNHRTSEKETEGWLQKNPSRDEPSGNGNFASLVPCIFSLESWNFKATTCFFLGGGWVGDTFDDPLKTEQQNHWCPKCSEHDQKTPQKKRSWKTPMVSWFRFCWFNYFLAQKEVTFQHNIWQRESIQSILFCLGVWKDRSGH